MHLYFIFLPAKLVGKPRGMVSSRADKGKAPMSAKKSRVLPKSSRGAKIPNDFLKTMPSKRTRASMETSATDRPEEGVAENVRPLKVRPPRFKEVSSEAGGGVTSLILNKYEKYG
ncbi:hypothetical protein ACOSP7_005191 [Xanthoceras sorbifolium]